MTLAQVVADDIRTRHHFAFDGSIAVSVYDLMFHDTNDVKPASSQADQSSEDANQRLFAPRFAGLAGDARTASDTDAVAAFPVITDAVVEMDCASSAWEFGDLVTVDEASGGTALENQKLVKTTDPALAIGYCVKREGSATTRVRARLISRVAGHTQVPVGAKNSMYQPLIPNAAQQTLAAGGGAVTVTEFYTAGASDAGGDAWTLADGSAIGQLKKIQLITDGGGDATLTPTNLNGGTTITFADAGDYCLLMWDGTGWTVLELGNDADGATGPALA